MTNDERTRFEDALTNGYMYTPADSDQLAQEWMLVAEGTGFPAVFITEHPLGMFVRCYLDPERLDTPIAKRRARRAFKKAVARGQVAGVVDGELEDGEIAGVYPEPVARDLARRVARINGHKWPKTEVQLIAPVLKGNA